MNRRRQPDSRLEQDADVQFEPDREQQQGHTQIGDELELGGHVIDVECVDHETGGEEADEGWQSNRRGKAAQTERDHQMDGDGGGQPCPPSWPSQSKTDTTGPPPIRRGERAGPDPRRME